MNKHTGSSFDDFLQEEGILEEVSAKAHKRLLALQLADIMKENSITKQHPLRIRSLKSTTECTAMKIQCLEQ